MPVTTAQFKNGMCIVHDGKRWVIVEFQHVKPGKGGAFVRTKLKELQSGRVVDYTFRSGEKFDDVRIETKKMQYLYNDGGTYYFMDTDSYEQVELDKEFVGEQAKWLKENDEVEVMTADGEYMGVEPPCSSNSKSPRPIPDSRVTQCKVAPNPRHSRPVQSSRCRCSSIPARS